MKHLRIYTIAKKRSSSQKPKTPTQHTFLNVALGLSQKTHFDNILPEF